ncbi:hypothetical protein [Pseudomonas sp. LRF_L74]|uniref:hypothetical protein n=1 Tax=Pseudomonas sp. LRF_L74 TaxID=3369422 RepID=UPI003F647358
MKAKGILPLIALPSLIALSGCVAPNGQQQYNANQLAGAGGGPCTPNATADLISTGRSLLEITNNVLATQQNLSGNSSRTYAQAVKSAENAQRVNQGKEVLNNVEALTGGPATPCG